MAYQKWRYLEIGWWGHQTFCWRSVSISQSVCRFLWISDRLCMGILIVKACKWVTWNRKPTPSQFGTTWTVIPSCGNETHQSLSCDFLPSIDIFLWTPSPLQTTFYWFPPFLELCRCWRLRQLWKHLQTICLLHTLTFYLLPINIFSVFTLNWRPTLFWISS